MQRNRIFPRRFSSGGALNRAVRPFTPTSATAASSREDSSAAHARELERLTRAMQALPERCRQVLTLRKIYGLTQREIAVRLGLDAAAVESSLAEAMHLCARQLERPERP